MLLVQIANGSINMFILCVNTITFHYSNFEYPFACSYCCKLFVRKDFWLNILKVLYSVFCTPYFVPYSGFLVYTTIKNEQNKE